MEKMGEQFLHKKDSRLHTTAPVKHEMERRKRRGETVSQKPADKLANWMEVLQQTHMGHEDDPRVLERIKNYYHKNHVIEPEDIPDSYFENQKRLAREQGHGDIEITDEAKRQAEEIIITDQITTLDNWIEYFTSSDSESYPMWAKYLTFNGMLKLSTYDKEKHAFGKRTKNTTAPFPDINREALAYVIDAIVKHAQNERVTVEEENPEFKKILDTANFGKLYAWAIEKVTPAQESELSNTAGEWIKYDQRSDHMPLVKSLQGHGTGWCTAGEQTAHAQLQGGDFYVYYSYDSSGQPTIPRIAIRMEDENIAEVRGIGPDQNMDSAIANSNILNEKLAEFGRKGEFYKKRSQDMKKLTIIENKIKNKQELTHEELRFLYEIDDEIKGFGYEKDPRIDELRTNRDMKSDIAEITGYPKDEISTNIKEALREPKKTYHYSDLNLSKFKFIKDRKLPKIISGSLYLYNLTSAEELELPESIGRNLALGGLTSAKGLKLPESIGGYLNLWGLTSAEGLELPESINGYLDLRKITSAKGLKLPKSIDGHLDLSGLTSAEGLELPESINGYLDLRKITSAKGLKLPKSIGGSLYLYNLTSAEGLELPESVGGCLDLRGLTSAEGLKLPESIGESLNLQGLTSAEGLKLSESVGGCLDLRGLTSAKGLKLPESIGGYLDLTGLTSAEGLELPKSIGTDLSLKGLTSAKGLKLPESVGGGLDLQGLTSAEGLKLPESIGGSIYLSGLTSAEGLKLPESIGGHLDLGKITSAKGLKLPESVGGNLNLRCLTSAEGLKLPESIGGNIYFTRLTQNEISILKTQYPHLLFGHK